jgi:hypothetical protein
VIQFFDKYRTLFVVPNEVRNSSLRSEWQKHDIFSEGCEACATQTEIDRTPSETSQRWGIFLACYFFRVFSEFRNPLERLRHFSRRGLPSSSEPAGLKIDLERKTRYDGNIAKHR